MIASTFLALTTIAVSPFQGAAQDTFSVAGAWRINRDLTPPMERPERDVDDRQRPPLGRGGGGGIGGRGGLGGRGGAGGGGRGGANRTGPDEKEMRKMNAVRSRLQDTPDRLAISIDGDRVQIVDGIGRATTLRADAKWQDRVTGDGEFKSKTRFDGSRLVVEEDFDGPKVVTTYEAVQAEPGRRLQVTVRSEGGRGGGDRGPAGNARPTIVRVYETDSAQ